MAEVNRAGLAAALAARGIQSLALGAGHHVVGWQAVLCGRRADPFTRVHAWRAGWGGPLVMLACDEADAVALLDAGADDAIVRRAGDALIAARLAALLRRAPVDPPIRLGSLTIDPGARQATRGAHALGLLPREFALLLHFARHHGRLLSRRDLLAAVWGLAFDPGTNVVEVHVSRLRARLDRGFAMPMLLTERGRGYRLVADLPIAAIAARR